MCVAATIVLSASAATAAALLLLLLCWSAVLLVVVVLWLVLLLVVLILVISISPAQRSTALRAVSAGLDELGKRQLRLVRHSSEWMQRYRDKQAEKIRKETGVNARFD